MISINPKFRNDKFQRYKFPGVISKITKRGNGTFTTIYNLTEISEALYHPENILFKAIGYNLATSINPKNNTIKGSHETSEIQEAIDKYVTSFILCPKCSIPELSLSVTGKKKKMKCEYSCSACGANEIFKSKGKENEKILQLIIKDIDSGNKWAKHSTADLEPYDIMFNPFEDL